jgi:enoyl-CoA hydratase / 3-hydroxyacyl-CoA dehydrogenase
MSFSSYREFPMTFNNPLLRRPSRTLPKCVVVVGAGTIGPDIGYYLKSAIPDLKLYLVDIAQQVLDRAIQRFTDYTRKAVERGKMSAAEAVKIRDKVHATVDYEVAREADTGRSKPQPKTSRSSVGFSHGLKR